MAVFINGAEAISPQHTFKEKNIPEDILSYTTMMKTVLPDFKAYFQPIDLRRMSRIIKSGSSTAIECLGEANIQTPEAILTGTGLGCLEDTEKFLNKMIRNNEELLTPTSFIQSTHNTIGAHVGITTKCHAYNVAYVHKTVSFELALLDAKLLLKEGKVNNVLVGGIDEITQENYDLKKRIALWKEEPFDNLEIYPAKTDGCIPGEGSAFFLLSKTHTESTYATLDMLEIVHRTESVNVLENRVLSQLKKAGLGLNDIDMVLFGYNGDKKTDKYYDLLKDGFFSSLNHAYYKHYCGEYDTASSFGFWLACIILRSGKVPANMQIGTNKDDKKIQRVLIYNQEDNKNHAFILLSSC